MSVAIFEKHKQKSNAFYVSRYIYTSKNIITYGGKNMPRKKSTKTQTPQVATAVQTPVSSSCCDCDCAKPAVESVKPSTGKTARMQKQQNFNFFTFIFSSL